MKYFTEIGGEGFMALPNFSRKALRTGWLAALAWPRQKRRPGQFQRQRKPYVGCRWSFWGAGICQRKRRQQEHLRVLGNSDGHPRQRGPDIVVLEHGKWRRHHGHRVES